MAICIFVISLHRCRGPCSGENTGGRYSLQGFTDVARWYISSPPCLFSSFTVNTLLINTDCLSPVLLVLLFVFPADRRVRFTSLIYSLQALISDVHTALHLSLVFCSLSLVLTRLRHNGGDKRRWLTCWFAPAIMWIWRIMWILEKEGRPWQFCALSLQQHVDEMSSLICAFLPLHPV